jgi:hypothetical protein
LNLQANTNLTWSHCAFGHEKVIVEVDEFGTEAEDGFVQDVVEFNHRSKSQSIIDAKFAGDVEIEDEEAWTNPGVAWKVTGLADGGDCE